MWYNIIRPKKLGMTTEDKTECGQHHSSYGISKWQAQCERQPRIHCFTTERMDNMNDYRITFGGPNMETGTVDMTLFLVAIAMLFPLLYSFLCMFLPYAFRELVGAGTLAASAKCGTSAACWRCRYRQETLSQLVAAHLSC